MGHENLLADVDFRQCLNNGASDECPRHGFSFAVGGLVYFPSLLHHKQYFYKRKLTDPRWARQREMSLWGTVSLLLLAVVRFAEVPARTGEIGNRDDEDGEGGQHEKPSTPHNPTLKSEEE